MSSRFLFCLKQQSYFWRWGRSPQMKRKPIDGARVRCFPLNMSRDKPRALLSESRSFLSASSINMLIIIWTLFRANSEPRLHYYDNVPLNRRLRGRGRWFRRSWVNLSQVGLDMAAWISRRLECEAGNAPTRKSGDVSQSRWMACAKTSTRA